MGSPESELFRLGARELSSLILAGEVSATEVVDAHIARIEAVDPKLNALVVRRFDAARDDARCADRKRAAGDVLGPLHGVPVTIKECLDFRGLPSTFGVESHRNDVATKDDPRVARLRDAGAIVLGKTNVAQILLFVETDNPVYGRTNNPWALDRSPGGSSGGEATIIAACGSPLGLGTDIGGSSRVPAAVCGIVGFKPTAGRMPDLGRGSMPIGQRAIPSQVGVFARHVEDVALGLDVANGGKNPMEIPLPIGDVPSVDVSRLTVGYYTDDGTFPPCAAAVRAVRESAQMLRDRGVRVVQFAPPNVNAALELLFGIFSADGGSGTARFLGTSRRDRRISALLLAVSAGPLKRKALKLALLATGRRRLAAQIGSYGRTRTAQYWDLAEALLDYRSRFADALDGAAEEPIDAILSPASALPAVRHGATQELGIIGAYSALYNVLGYPAGVLPATSVRAEEETSTPRSSDRMDRTARATERGSVGLPIGVQVAARPFQEHVALAVMRTLETSLRANPGYPRLDALAL